MFPPNRFGPPRQRPPFPPPNNVGQNPQQNPLNYFKKPDGHWDIDKISGSIGQMNKLVGQVSPMVKQLNGFMKKL
ncbi:YppG family protein [Litchfieldia salsa]|uniref:YppG-like protein n=1 Tax=Litchfieldia salsa TaxID=930152 RepID=A0A1H0UUR8_9BACI|nr:YppG family protein [Litchfieldia salsa]SDP70009.1 YppG-like protein [Litchfieldia salsa]